MKTILLMDIVIAFFGIYLGVIAIRMKKTGKINSVVVAEDEIKKCEEKAKIREDRDENLDYIKEKIVSGNVKRH